MKLLLIFSIIVLISTVAFGQNDFPANNTGKRANAFMQMVNSESDEELRNFLRNEMTPNNDMSPQERFELFQRIRKDLSGAKVLEVVDSSDEKITFLVKASEGRILKLSLAIAPDKENRISELGIEMSPRGGLGSGPKIIKKMPEAGLLPSVEKYLNDLSNTDEFSGVVLIAKDGKPIFQNAYGYANKEFKVPNKMDTKFNIGSLNKTFTSYAIGILADEGKLSLDDKIGKHLPDYPNKEAAQKATIYHLLTMSSGIGDFFDEKFDETPKHKLRSISDYMPLFSSKPLEFEPGTNQKYSNGGYLVLGAIIEKVSGQSYYDFVRERIFKPADMNDTDSYATDEIVPNMAHGYTTGEFGKIKGERKNNIYTLPARGSSAGGGYSTATDLLKFINAINSGKLPVPDSLNKAKGIMDADMYKRGFRAAGGAMGVNSMILSKLPDNYTVIVLSNYDPPSATNVGMQISEWIRQ